MLIKRKYLCIFCGKRMDASELLYHSKHIGMCRSCLSKLSLVPHPPVFPVSGDIDYVISPLFYTGEIRKIIIEFKFNGQSAYADILSALMCGLLNDMVHIADFDYVVPVPLSKKRLFERGYNQSALLAEPFAKFFGIPFRDDILFKTKETKHQSSISFSERHTNLKGAFMASDAARDKNIILFDDILTTGSTLAECSGTLKNAGAKNIAGITLAVSENSENIFNHMY